MRISDWSSDVCSSDLQAFDAERQAVLALLDRPDYHRSVTQPGYDAYPTAVVFAKLLTLSDEDVLRIAACVMAETLEAGSAVVEAVEIGRAHVCTPVTNAQLVCRLLLEKKKKDTHLRK